MKKIFALLFIIPSLAFGAFTEFYCQSGGNNVNAGSTTNNTAAYTSTNGNWNGSTTFTPSDTQSSSLVSVGDWASVYNDGSTTGVYIARVTTVNSSGGNITSIVLSSTAKAGAAPTSSATGRSIKVGGAWLGGGSGATFPLALASFNAATNANGDAPRINLKNDQTYTYTAAQTFSGSSNTTVQGYTSSPGDGGKATLTSNVTTGANFSITAGGSIFVDLIFANTGASNSNDLVSITATSTMVRVVGHGARGSAFTMGVGSHVFVECEAYDFNKSNTSTRGGYVSTGGSVMQLYACLARDSSSANADGVIVNAANAPYVSVVNSIFHNLGGNGINIVNGTTNTLFLFSANDFYSNGVDGIKNAASNSNSFTMVRNSNFIKNTGKGLNFSGTSVYGLADNNGYGAGTMANGATDVLSSVVKSGTVTYASNTAPYVDATTGDFRINLQSAYNAGRGAFTQTDSNYGTSTVAYPDIGSAQHNDTCSGTGPCQTSGASAQ